MTAAAQPDQDSVVPQAHCWCCGADFAEDELIRLGQHPEVGVCLNCTRYLYRRRRERLDRGRTGMPARVRSLIQAARDGVIHRGWHRRPVIGSALRWIDKHLP